MDPLKITGVVIAVLLLAIAGHASSGVPGLVIGLLIGTALALSVVGLLRIPTNEGHAFDPAPTNGVDPADHPHVPAPDAAELLHGLDPADHPRAPAPDAAELLHGLDPADHPHVPALDAAELLHGVDPADHPRAPAPDAAELLHGLDPADHPRAPAPDAAELLRRLLKELEDDHP